MRVLLRPGSLIPALIDHEIISTVILRPSADSFKEDCCQLQVKVFAQSTGFKTACSSLPRKKMWLGDLTVPT